MLITILKQRHRALRGLSTEGKPKPPKSHIYWKNPFFGGFLFFKRSLGIAQVLLLMKIFFYVGGGQPAWNIFGYKFAMDGPNDLIFWLHA